MRSLTLALLLLLNPVVLWAQGITILPQPLGKNSTPIFNGLGPLTGPVTLDPTTGNAFRRQMTTPGAITTVPGAAGTLDNGTYAFRLVAVDMDGGTTLPGAEATCTTVAGPGAGSCALSWAAVVGAVSYRIYGSAVGAEDRYQVTTDLSYVWTTAAGATVAALPVVNTAYRFNLGGTQDWLGRPLTINIPAIGATSTDALVLKNPAAAAAGAQQWSPRLHFIGQGWATTSSASMPVEFEEHVEPIQGTTAPTFSATAQIRINNGTWIPVWQLNVGTNANSFGASALYGNTGAYANGFGHQALYNNTGLAANGFGYSALWNNNWPYALAIGDASTLTFQADTGTDKAFAYADVNGTAHTITFGAAHGFGTVGEKINLLFTKTAGTAPTGLVTGNVYLFTVTSTTVLTLSAITDSGSVDFAGKLTNSVDVTNSIAIGANVQATKANQAVLGPNTITETVLRGAIQYGASGAATSGTRVQKKVTGIADNSATAVLTVTVPNANEAAAIRLLFVSSNGSTDAFESSRSASGMVVVARTAGANAVATAATLDDAAIATVAAGATHTLAYAVSAISGAPDAVNTFTVTVTIDDSGNVGGNQCVIIAELLNAEATGVTIQ